MAPNYRENFTNELLHIFSLKEQRSRCVLTSPGDENVGHIRGPKAKKYIYFVFNSFFGCP